MYEAITEKFKFINQSEVSKNVGINVATMNRIVNKKILTNKRTAYCIVKTIHQLAEIEDYFIQIEKKGE